MKTLVCGGAGYVGTHLVRELLRQTQHTVITVDSLVGCNGCARHLDTEGNWRVRAGSGSDVAVRTNAVLPRRFTHLEVGDIRDETFLENVFTEHGPIDAVVHLSAYTAVPESVREPLKYYDNNVLGLLRLLQAMRRHGCEKLVFSSSAALFGSSLESQDGNVVVNSNANSPLQPIRSDARCAPTSPYGATKLVGERMLKDCAAAYGLKSVCLRYFNACGASKEGDIGEVHEPESHLIPLLLRVPLAEQINAYNAKHHPSRPRIESHATIYGTDYPTPDGTCIRDYVHVTDLARAHLRALERLATLRLEDHGKFFSVFNLGTSRGHSVREVIETARRVTGHPIPIKEEARRAGDPPVLVASAEAARKELGWKPEYDSLERIIASAWNFHRRHPVGYEEWHSV